MSLESYVTGLMKEPAPKGMDRLVLSGLSQLEKMYFAQVEKKRTADMAARSPPSSAEVIKAALKKKAAVYRMGDPSSYLSRWQGTSPT